MTIQVLGSGCSTCKKLYEITKKAVKDLNLSTEVEYITDVTKIIEMGVMTTPVLAINGNPVLVGFNNDIEKIKELISNGNETTLVKETNCCDCKISNKKSEEECKCKNNLCCDC